MTKFFCLILIIVVSVSALGQVGINTTSPNGTLDVEGKPTITTELDGIIPPRITGNQLQAKTYTPAQNGIILYVTSPATAPSGQTINVNSSGLYYFNSGLNQWISVSQGSSIKNVYCNNNDPNIATVFDDQLPTVAHDAALLSNNQYTYYGLDSSVWLWNGTAYTSNNVTASLLVGQRVSVSRTMLNSVPNTTHLPASGLIELDGLVRVGLMKQDNTFYKPYLENISGNSINITFSGSTTSSIREPYFLVQVAVPAGTNVGLDANNAAYWNSTTEVRTANVALPNGNWYEIEWFAYTVGTYKQIYMTALRKF